MHRVSTNVAGIIVHPIHPYGTRVGAERHHETLDEVDKMDEVDGCLEIFALKP